MPCIITNGRLYFFGSGVLGAGRYKTHLVKTSRGLLFMTDRSNFSTLNGVVTEPPFAGPNNGQRLFKQPEGEHPGFFIFNSTTQTLEVHSGSGSMDGIPYNAIPDMGYISLFKMEFARSIHEMCLSEPELGIEAIYRGEANGGSHGPFVELLLQHKDGIPLENLYAHPYAIEIQHARHGVFPNQFARPTGYIAPPYNPSFPAPINQY